MNWKMRMIVITSLGHVASNEINTSKALPRCPALAHSKHPKNKNLLWENFKCLKRGERQTYGAAVSSPCSRQTS